MFKIGKLEFEVKDASFTGSFMDAVVSKRNAGKGEPELLWLIDINMEEGKFSTDETVMPNLYHNNGFQMNVRSWKDIEGITLNWDSEFNENGEEAGSLYVFEHEEVTKGTIEFLERRGTKFVIRWTGTANVYWNDEYGADVPFSFEGEVEFKGINVLCEEISTLKELKAVMMNFIDIEEFDCIAEESRKNGAAINYMWKFEPQRS